MKPIGMLKSDLDKVLTVTVPAKVEFEITLYPAEDREEHLAFPAADSDVMPAYRLADGDVTDVLRALQRNYNWRPPSLHVTTSQHLEEGNSVNLRVELADGKLTVVGIRT